MVKKEKESGSKNSKLDKMLVENFVALQKVLVNLSMKLDGLTNKMSDLLKLFETSAKSLSEKGFDYGKYADGKNVSQKIDTLLEQNKAFAKGLALMYEKPELNQQISQQPQEPAGTGMEMAGYQRSLGAEQESNNSKFKPLQR